MAKDFLHYYNIEMQYMRDMCGEFARDFPKVASRFGMDEFSCEDPYVERLLQGHAFLVARAHQALDGGFPELSHAMLNNLYPDFLTPIPSTGIVKLFPAQGNEIPPDGTIFERGAELTAPKIEGGKECYFQTAHDVKIWPIDIIDAKYYPDDISPLGLNRSAQAQSCLCLELKTNNGVKFKSFNMDCLEFYLTDTAITMELFEMLLANCSEIIVQPKNGGIRESIYNSRKDVITSRGFDLEDSLFPTNPQTFEGYRLFRKFFALPQSFMFIQVDKIKRAIKKMDSDNINLIFVFDRENQALKGKVGKKNFDLFCTPVSNLFLQVFSDIDASNGASNLDFLQDASFANLEIIKVLNTEGCIKSNNSPQTLTKLYSNTNLINNDSSTNNVYYSLKRSPRTFTKSERESETKTNYAGTDTYLSFFDQNHKPYKGHIEQLRIIAQCSNRDLPVTMLSNKENTYLITDSANVKMDKIELVSGPTKPCSDHLFIPPWEIINHMSLNFLAQNDEIPEGIDALGDYMAKSSQKNRGKLKNIDHSRFFESTAEIIKKILGMYTVSEAQKKHIEGIKSISTKRKQQRFNNKGDFSFVNGLSIDLIFDNQKTNNYFLLGMVIDKFFEHATPVDTFTQTTVSTKKQGKIIQWPARKGTRPLI